MHGVQYISKDLEDEFMVYFKILSLYFLIQSEKSYKENSLRIIILLSQDSDLVNSFK
jgi:hypothetical protein